MNVTVTKENESVIYNGKIYSHGQAFDVDDVIGKSLVERGYVAETAQTAPEGENSLEDLTYAELKKLAAERGVEATGRKVDIIARLRAMESDSEEADDLSNDEENPDELPNTGMPE